MEDRKAKCTVRDAKFVEPCTALGESVSGSAFDRKKGVVAWNYINVAKREPTPTFYGVRSGAHEVNGLAFNFCPFCGTDISGAILRQGRRRRGVIRFTE